MVLTKIEYSLTFGCFVKSHVAQLYLFAAPCTVRIKAVGFDWMLLTAGHTNA